MSYIALGYLACAMNVVANLMLAHKRWCGWALRILTNLAWVGYAAHTIDGGPVAANHVVFLAINFYGLQQWRKAKQVESAGVDLLDTPQEMRLKCTGNAIPQVVEGFDIDGRPATETVHMPGKVPADARHYSPGSICTPERRYCEQDEGGGR